MINDFSRYYKSISLKLKSETKQMIKNFIIKIKIKEYKMKTIYKDDGIEFKSAKFKKWLKEKEIKKEDLTSYTLE
jgi:hypothetical protein